MGYMSSLYSSMCVVIHNKGTGVDKISCENETTLTQIYSLGRVLTLHSSSEFTNVPLKHTRVVTYGERQDCRSQPPG